MSLKDWISVLGGIAGLVAVVGGAIFFLAGEWQSYQQLSDRVIELERKVALLSGDSQRTADYVKVGDSIRILGSNTFDNEITMFWQSTAGGNPVVVGAPTNIDSKQYHWKLSR
ncbi:MAG: hypothetical protein AAF501_09395 [Pseudomonadota bacterium]